MKNTLYLKRMVVLCSPAVPAVYVANVVENANAIPVEKYTPPATNRSWVIVTELEAGIANESNGTAPPPGVVAVLWIWI